MAGSVSFSPIGLIRTPFTSTAGMPIQAVVARDVPAGSSSTRTSRRAWRTSTVSAT